MSRSVLTGACILSVIFWAVDAIAAQFVATTWGDNSVHLLDANLNHLDSFPTGTMPNGVATHGNLIWVGFGVSGTQEIIAYNFGGVEHSRFTTQAPGLQGMEYIEYVNDPPELAVMDYDQSDESYMIEFYDPSSGNLNRSFPAVAPTVDGIAWDGEYLWQLETDYIYATSIQDGSAQFWFPNPAANEPFGGTGLTNYTTDSLLIGALTGNWYEVSKEEDGNVLDQGNNGLDMSGLKYVPEPTTFALLALGGLAVIRKRRRQQTMQ